MFRAAILLALLALPAVAIAAASEERTHPLTIHDMLAMDRISDPQASPDGKRIVFVVSRTDLEANKRRTDLWLVAADGTGLRRLTSHDAGDSSPRWTTDGGSVLFLSTRSGSSQVWRIAVDGGEAQQVTSLPLDVSAFLPSPDGKTLLVAMDVFPDATVDGTQKRLDEATAKKSSGKIYDRLFVRHWDEWTDGRRSHLFVLPLAGGTPVDLMKGMDADCPSKPFGGVEEIAFAPDGKTVVFSARNVGREEAWSTNFDLHAVPADGSATPRSFTSDNPAQDTAPAFSPDGKTLAYLAMKVPGYEADRRRIVLKGVARWPLARAYRGVGPVARHDLLVGGRQDDPCGRGERRPDSALRRGRRDGQGESRGGEGDRALPGSGGGPDRVRPRPPQVAGGALLREAGRDRRPGGHADQRGEGGRRADGRAGAVHLQGLERRDRPGLRREAGGLRPREEVPRGVPDPRRPAGIVRQRLSLPLEPAGLRRRRLRRGDGRFPRLDRLRPGLLATRSAGTGAASRSRTCRRGSQRLSRSTRGWTATASPRWAPPTAAT